MKDGKRVREDVKRELEVRVVLLKPGRRQPLETGKGKETESPLGPPNRM